MRGICSALEEAWRMQGNKNAGILFIRPDVLCNVFDHVSILKKCDVLS